MDVWGTIFTYYMLILRLLYILSVPCISCGHWGFCWSEPFDLTAIICRCSDKIGFGIF